jgi:hypothetical protein
MTPSQGNPRRRRRLPEATTGVVFVALLLSLISLAAWITHILVSFRAGAWALLISGAIAFPVAVVHGIGIWMDVW